MNKNLFKLFLGAFVLFSAAAFTGCSDNDDPLVIPVLNAAPSTLTFENVEGEASKVVTIETNCAWKVQKSNLDWATISPESGEGSGQITVKVGEMNEGETSRTGTISFVMIHPVLGNMGVSDSKVTVKQTSGDDPGPGPVGDELYYENCGTQVSKVDGYWPYVDAFEGWSREGTLDQSSVTYSGASSSVRNSGKAYDPNADDGISGAPYVAVKTFDINHINVGSNTNFTFTFVALNTVSTLDVEPYTPTFGTITPSSLNFSVSMDGGTTYSPVAFTATKTTSDWYSCSAPFRFPAGSSASEISVRFDGFNGGTTLRVDDMRLMEGGNGPELKPEGPVGQATIAEVIAGTVGNTFTTQGQVVAINGRSFLIQDATGRILVYRGWDKETSKPVIDYNAVIGQTVKVTGSTTTYSKLVQFSETGLVIEKLSDGTFTQPTPEKFDGAAFEAYKAATTPVIKYIEYTGTLTIDGFYYNVAVEGTSLQGSLAYPDDGFVDASLGGQEVTVTGYTLGMTNGAQMLSTLATSVKAAATSSDPAITGVNPTSVSFTADGETKSVAVTAVNTDGCTLSATVTDNHFTATVSGLTSVSVVAPANTTDAAINATLTIALMKGGTAVSTKTVALSQAKKSSSGGGGETITMTYTDIISGGKDMPENSYGSQNVNDPATYYTWSFSSLDFAGAKICIANAKDYEGLIQMQGNASDAAKQGFFGNVSDLGKITKIVVVSKNTKYEPTEHLYMGASAYPKGNAQTRTSLTQDGMIYTETFEISGDYGFFSIANDKQGAFYVQSVEITYEK